LGIRTTDADAPGVDLSRLTAEEQQELTRLAGKTRRLPTGRWVFSALDDAELELLRELVAKGQAVLPQESGAGPEATSSTATRCGR